MKKIFCLLLAIILVLSFASCQNQSGGKDKNKSKVEQLQYDLTTVEGFLKAFGLNEEDMKCKNFSRVDKISYNDKNGDIYAIGSYVSEKVENADTVVWVEHITNKLKKLADKNTFTVLITYNIEGKLTANGYYNYKGHKVMLDIKTDPDASDGGDTADADATCILSLKFK